MRVGPLGCLALLGAGTIGWAIGRLPDVLRGMAVDIASADGGVEEVAVAVAGPLTPVAAPPVRVLPSPNPPHPAGGRQRPLQSQNGQLEQVAAMGAGMRQHGGTLEEVAFFPEDQPLTLAASLALAIRGAPRDAVYDPLQPFPPLDPLRTASPGGESGFALATTAYEDLAAGNRQHAATHFAAALAADPKAENADAWRRSLRQLTRRWTSDAYVIMRDGGPADLGTTPVLGGGQGGRSFAYTATPLAQRPLFAVIRTTGGRTRGLRVDGESDSEQAAFGVRWQVVRGATVSIERLFAVTDGGRTAWTMRVAGGRTRKVGALVADAYAEAGIVGLQRADLVAGVQARLFKPDAVEGLRFESGVGLWSGIQHTGEVVGRLDVGPTLSIVADTWHVRASVDYRFRVAGNAAPGSGPALTVSRSF